MIHWLRQVEMKVECWNSQHRDYPIRLYVDSERQIVKLTMSLKLITYSRNIAKCFTFQEFNKKTPSLLRLIIDHYIYEMYEQFK